MRDMMCQLIQIKSMNADNVLVTGRGSSCRASLGLSQRRACDAYRELFNYDARWL